MADYRSSEQLPVRSYGQQTDIIKTESKETAMTKRTVEIQTDPVKQPKRYEELKLDKDVVSFLNRVLPRYSPLWEDEQLDFSLYTAYPPPNRQEQLNSRKNKKKKQTQTSSSDKKNKDALNEDYPSHYASSPFDDYDNERKSRKEKLRQIRLGQIDQDDQDDDNNEDIELKTKKEDGTEYIQEKHMHCSSISWNCTGRLLAVSYGQMDHEGWCLHKGVLNIWSVFHEDLGKKKKQDQDSSSNTQYEQDPQSSLFASLDTTSCLMCASCHPDQPAIFAGGTFSGEVYVWDLHNKDEPTRLISNVDRETHSEPITAITWIKYGVVSVQYYVCSLGADGLICLWSTDNRLIHPINRYSLLTTQIPSNREGASRVRRGQTGIGIPSGGSSFDFCGSGAQQQSSNSQGNVGSRIQDSTQFYIGTDIGTCFKGNLTKDPKFGVGLSILKASNPQQTQQQTSSSGTAGQLPTSFLFQQLTSAVNPIVFTYSEHVGPVNGVCVCHRHRNLFATAGADGMLHIRNSFMKQPPLSYDTGSPLFCIQWSQSAPRLLASGNNKGELTLYLISRDKIILQSSIIPCREVGGSSSSSSSTFFISGFDKAILATAPPPIFSLSFSATSPFIACGDGW
ncbi:MAG: putative WD repeat domain 34 L homeolog, partial [Streblomastix strix]